MKLVTAVIKPHKWEEVREALAITGVAGLTVTEASGHGQQKGHTEIYRATERDVSLVPKIRLEVVVGDDEADGVVHAIASAAQTGTIGDGKIWVVPIDQVVRVRTGETDAAAV